MSQLSAVHVPEKCSWMLIRIPAIPFKTVNGGQSWTIISPDLTTNDTEKQKLSGGPVNPDNSHAEYYCTIISIAESPKDAKLIWVGTDDGNVQLTRDGGAHWTNLTKNVAGMPQGSWIDAIRPSFGDAGTAYMAIDQHRMDLGAHLDERVGRPFIDPEQSAKMKK